MWSGRCAGKGCIKVMRNKGSGLGGGYEGGEEGEKGWAKGLSPSKII